MTKRILLMTICLMTLWCSLLASPFAAERGDKDSYLTSLFTPQFPYKSVKVVEFKNGTKMIEIKGVNKITPKLQNEYNDLLLSRGVNVYGEYRHGYFSWQTTVSDYAITITRKVPGEPDTIEVSTSTVKEKGEPVIAANVKGKTLQFIVEQDFGRTWKKIKIMPDKEPKIPDAKIGRYPGAKMMEKTLEFAKGGHSDGTYFYVSKDSLKNVYKYYHEKCTKYYKIYHSKNEYESIITRVIENPHYRVPDNIFGIKTTGKFIGIHCFDSINNMSDDLTIKLTQSLDSNLMPYVQIYIHEM